MVILKSVSTIAGIFYVASNEGILNSEIYITVFFFMEKVVYTLSRFCQQYQGTWSKITQ